MRGPNFTKASWKPSRRAFLCQAGGGLGGIALATMLAEEEAQAAIQALDGADLDGRNIKVNEAHERQRGGGGRREQRY